MTLPQPNQPATPQQPAPAQPSPSASVAAEPGAPALGRWALGLGIAALVCGAIGATGAALSMLGIFSVDVRIATSIGTLVGLTAIGLGIAAAVSRRGRRAGIVGIVTAVAGALLWGLVWAGFALYALIGFGAVIVDKTS